MNGRSSKINRQTFHPSNKIDIASTEVQVRTPPRLDETNDIVKVGLISALLVSAFLTHRFFFWKRSTRVPVTGSLSLIFDLAASGHANNYNVNNVARALADRLTVKFAGEIVQGIDGYDPFKLYEDFLLAENEKASMIREGIQPVDLSKIRCNAEDKNKRGVDKENKLNDVYENKYRIPLDYEILKDDGVFLPRALSDKLLFELSLAPVGSVEVRSNEALTLTNIHHEYEVIHSQELADEALSNYEMERDQCRSK